MGSKVKTLIDAGPFQQTPYFSSDQAAQHVQNLAAHLQETLSTNSGACASSASAAAPAPAVVVMQEVASHTAPPVDQAGALDLLKQLVKVIIPLNWDDFVANLIMFIIFVSLVVFVWIVCKAVFRCLWRDRRKDSYNSVLYRGRSDPLGLLLE